LSRQHELAWAILQPRIAKIHAFDGVEILFVCGGFRRGFFVQSDYFLCSNAIHKVMTCKIFGPYEEPSADKKHEFQFNPIGNPPALPGDFLLD
jgi:hypothetical protein